MVLQQQDLQETLHMSGVKELLMICLVIEVIPEVIGSMVLYRSRPCQVHRCLAQEDAVALPRIEGAKVLVQV